MSDPTVSPDTLTLLAGYDTPTVCNVIELFGVRPRSAGYMNRTIQACFPDLAPIVGYAATATFRASSPAGPDAYATLEQQIEAFAHLPGPPVVVFQDLDDPPAAATFGEIMCTAYQSFGAVGLITSGAGRDLDQVHAIGFPVFTSGAICAHGYCHFPSVGDPVQVGGTTVRPGDLLHADRNGVTTIPLEIADEVAACCAEFVRAEAATLDYLNAGGATMAGLADARARSAAMIERLRRRVGRRGR